MMLWQATTRANGCVTDGIAHTANRHPLVCDLLLCNHVRVIRVVVDLGEALDLLKPAAHIGLIVTDGTERCH